MDGTMNQTACVCREWQSRCNQSLDIGIQSKSGPCPFPLVHRLGRGELGNTCSVYSLETGICPVLLSQSREYREGDVGAESMLAS